MVRRPQPPNLGGGLLGDNTGYDSLRSRLQDTESAFFLIRSAGAESFKGSGFVRGGIYDRVQVGGRRSELLRLP